MTNRTCGTTSIRAAAALLLCCVSGLIAGCSASQFMSGDTQPMTGAAIQGAVHGGQQPIVGATVQLWVVGSGSYGAAASALGSSVTTGAGGTFTIGAYTCPSSSALVYLTSSGGNPGLSASNPNIELAAALGACSGAASDTVIINEVTTAAAAYALGQYFTTTFGGSSTDSFGAPSTTQAQTGIANAFATVNNLVTFNTGAAVTSATLTNAGLTVTATPESAKLNTVADILAACVNSLGTSDPDGYCTALFADVAPTGATQPTDTLQAAVYMSLNPTSNNTNGSTANLTALYALQTGIAAPFVGVSSQPTDWTIGIQYTGSTPLNDPQNMAADASGNIWVINHNGTSLASLTELSPTGMPVVNASTIAGQNINALQPRNEAIDTNGNIWFDNTSSPSHFFEYNVLSPSSSIDVLPAGGGSPYGVAIDGSNNVFFTHESSSATATVEEFLGGTLSSSAEVEYALYSPGGTNQQPEYAAIDTSGNLWMTNGTSTSGLESNIFQMSAYNGSTACTVFPCVASTAGDTTLTQTYTDMVSASGGVPALSEPYGVAAGTAGTGVWLGNQTGNTVTNMTSTTAGTNYGSATSLNKPQYVAIDGAGNVWVSNGASSSNGSVSEFAGTGAGVGSVLSPVNSGTAPFTAIGFTHSGINTAEGITIDPSGNVWTAGQVATTGGVFEIVGAAAPTVTPISLALKNSAVGKKP